MSKFRICTDLQGGNVYNIDVEAEECFAIDNHNINVNGAILNFKENTTVMNTKEVVEADKIWSDFGEYVKVKSKENYIKNNIKRVASKLMYQLDESNSQVSCDINEEYLIYVEQDEDPCYKDDYESKDFFHVQLVHTQSYDVIETVATSGISKDELGKAISYLIKKNVK